MKSQQGQSSKRRARHWPLSRAGAASWSEPTPREVASSWDTGEAVAGFSPAQRPPPEGEEWRHVLTKDSSSRTKGFTPQAAF